ncbi:general stress protein [Massilia sp. PAMC28688]|uniref:general stress protein n=1 Tax=Massilia sp. PAMC28688 TaxID=2861283 RepID=UPI001C62B18C|nr:general stress protein [Massilia sp. PAMC28688]QYF93900.1 general stress protein [Massilia sp. PAMC28688]
MQHTLIAVFDNRTDAQAAMDELMLQSFSPQDVRLSEDTARMGKTPSSESTEDEGVGASIKHFFRDLFGSDDDVYSNRYSTAVDKGHHVLTVTARTEAEVERAGDIVDRFGPVDIDEKEAEWDGTGIPNRAAMRMASAGSMQHSEANTLQFQQDRNLFAQQSLNEETPMGQTYQEPMGQPVGLTSVRRGGARVFSR